MTRKDEFEQAKNNLKSNFDEAWHKIMSLAESGFEEAMEFVALSYYYGDNVPIDEPLAYKWFQKIVEIYPNNGFIWNKIADCFLYGYGIQKNHNEAIKFYQKAWENGYIEAGAQIGWIYSFGDISENDDMTAAMWFQRSADKGSLQGMYYLGFFYSNGYGGLPISKKMASKYLKQAAEQEYFPAIRYLLEETCYGDYEGYLRLREKLISMAESGDDRAQNALGRAYLYGGDVELLSGFEKNSAEAKRWLELSALQGNVDSIFELGKNLLRYDSGLGVDTELGEKYLLEAADKGEAKAYYELYHLYKNIKQDPEKSLYWAERAAENGYSFLAYDIAECYFNGIGTEVNYQKAEKYYREYIKDDHEDIWSNLSYLPLAKCYLIDNSIGSDKYKDAYVYLKKALEAANDKEYCLHQKREIEYWIGYMFDNGLGVKRNLDEAFRHYSKSAELGFSKAQDEMKRFKKSIFGWRKI